MSQRYLAPSSGGLRQPTDPGKDNGFVVNPPRYSALGGLDGAARVKPSVNKAPFENGNPFHISKPNGGRGG